MPTPDRWTDAVARLSTEQLLTAGAAAAVVGERTHPWTITRWITQGKRGVYLDGMRGSGKGWYTSREALRRFFAELSRASVCKVVESPVRDADARRAAGEVERLKVLRRLSGRATGRR